MLQVPLIATPAQQLNITLGQQPCRIVVRQLSTGLYLYLYVSDVLVIGGVLCLNDDLIVRNSYLGFLGDLYFHDTLGSDDPSYQGLGGRFVLLWLDPTVDA